MNRPASKEPSMDEILSSIRQIIADDEPQQDDAAPTQQQDEEATARGKLSDMLDDVDADGEATTIEVEDGPHPDIEAAPIERKDVAAEALAEAQQPNIEPEGDAEEPLALSIDQMLKPSNSNFDHDPADEELIADPGEVVPTTDEEIDMASLLLQESAAQESPAEDDAKSIEDLVPDEVAQVVPDDIAFINDDDAEEQGDDTDSTDPFAGMGIDEESESEAQPLTAAEHEPMMQAQPEAVQQPEPESPLPDKDLSSDIADSLLEPTAQAATSHAFSQLDNLILSQKQGQTIEDLIREMLRPMLKAWLDENLPGVVEQLVQREIERVSRGKR